MAYNIQTGNNKIKPLTENAKNFTWLRIIHSVDNETF
jgi:hypothetical protein